MEIQACSLPFHMLSVLVLIEIITEMNERANTKHILNVKTRIVPRRLCFVDQIKWHGIPLYP